MSRFVDSMDWDSKTDDALRYIVFHVNKMLKALDPADENYAFFYTRYSKILNLTNALLGDFRFEFDSRDDLLDLFNDKAKMLNQRAITDALMAHGYSKNKFLNELTARYTGKQIITGPAEGTAIGNLLMQMFGTGEIESVKVGREIIKNAFDIEEAIL
jgi:hypothetical protein